MFGVRRPLLLSTLFLPILPALIGLVRPKTAHAEDWPPVSTEELKMTSEPKAPGAPAIYLFRQVDRDDSVPKEYEYARIKILTEEGKKTKISTASRLAPFVRTERSCPSMAKSSTR